MQWNCRGLLHNIDDINYFLSDLCLIAMALQETHLTFRHTQVLRNGHIFRRGRASSHFSGVVADVMQRGVACSEVPLDTLLEAVAARVSVTV